MEEPVRQDDLLVVDAHLATMRPGTPWGAVPQGAVLVQGGRVAWVGPEADLPASLVTPQTRRLSAHGGWVTPGLIDCHTHLVFGGDRADEFEQRLQGVSYEEIARAGGGILSSVRATRAASESDLLASGRRRLGWLTRSGVTTVEIKSGYGLDVETEIRMLRVAGDLSSDVTIHRTLLAAHALPPEFATDRAGYLDLVCDEVIPRVAEEGLADGVDAFLEGIAFTADECARVLTRGQEFGMAVRLHADQLSDGSGAALAASLGARSADHVEYTSEAGARAMAAAGTTAVLLPGAFYFLSEERKPPIQAFRDAGVPMALATDLNPGSSPVASPLAVMNLACVLFGLTPEEALAGMTTHAAPVLGMAGQRGVIAEGAMADLVIWDIERPAELAYWLGRSPARVVVREGRVVHGDSASSGGVESERS